MQIAPTYRAFISYSHADRRWAKWLHRRLERFRLGTDLVGRETAVGRVPNALRPIFRDRDDFTAGHSLTEQTLAALDASAALIVLASPAAAGSHYVNEEIRLFKQRHPGRPIVPVILRGKPNGGRDECFPPSLRFIVGADGAVTEHPVELLAADVRKEGDGEELALAKVVARLIGVSTDDVLKREAIAATRRIKLLAAAGTGVAVLVLIAGFLAWERTRQRERDERMQVAIETVLNQFRLVNPVLAGEDGKRALRPAIKDTIQGAVRDPRLARAAQLLGEGDVKAAEQLLNEVADETAARVRDDRKVAAAAYRNLGAISGLADQKRAREAYGKALAFDDDDKESLYWHGYLHFLAGDLAKAERSLGRLLDLAKGDDRQNAFRSHLRLGQVMVERGNLASAREHIQKAIGIARFSVDPGSSEWAAELSEAQTKLGGVLVALGDLPSALETLKAALAIRLRLSQSDAGNLQWQRDTLVSHQEIARVFIRRGQLEAALESYQAAIGVAERLTGVNPANVQWQRDLGLTHNDIAEVLVTRGRLERALASFRKALAIRTSLADADTANVQFQRDVALSRSQIGDVLARQGNLPLGLRSMNEAHAAISRLATLDQGNARWQHDLSVSKDQIGQMLAERGNLPAALENFRSSLAIRERLAMADPSNAQWQRNLAVSHNLIGDMLLEQGDTPAAADRYRSALAIIERLSKEDPDNAEWQRDLSLSKERLGAVSAEQDNVAAALASVSSALLIRERLSTADTSNAQWQRELMVAHNLLGDLMLRQDNVSAAEKSFDAGFAIATTLAAVDPSNAEWKRDLSVAHNKRGELLTAKNDLAGALASFRAALSARIDLANSDSAYVLWQRDLAVSHSKVGDILERLGDLRSALDAYRSAYGIAESLTKLDPTNSMWERDVGVSRLRIATIEAQIAQRAAAARGPAPEKAVQGAQPTAEEDRRLAALDMARQEEERRRQEQSKLDPKDAERIALIRQIQDVLKRAQCFAGAIDGISSGTQDAADRFVARYNSLPTRAKLSSIDLAIASAQELEAWLKRADSIKGVACLVAPRAPPPRRMQDGQRAPSYSPPRSGGGGVGPIHGAQ
jgi:tetratricopeptide (TPR) repeat protein